MSVTTTTGKPIGDYEDYHTEDGQPIADVSYFEQDAVIPLSGKYNQSDAKKTTKSVKLSDVIGGGTILALVNGEGYTPVSKMSVGSGMAIEVESGEAYITIECDEETITNDGVTELKVLYDDDTITVDDNGLEVKYDDDTIVVDEQHGLQVKNPVPTPGTNQNRGKVLTVNGSDQVVWDEPASGLPDTTGHSQGDVLTIDVSGPSWTAPAHIPVIGTINITPAPSYNYVILQNFLDGHTIGTPISEEDYSDFNNTYPSDKSAIGWSGNWSDTNLVSTTAGSQLLYSEAGFDFSKYGLTTGQLPFGYVNAEWDWNMGAGYRDITLPSEFTYEVWFNSPNNDWEGTFIAFYKANWDALKIVLDDERIFIMFDDTIFEVDRYKPSGSSSYTYEPDQATYEKAFPLSAGQWHHFALSCDGTNLYVFIDGKLLGNIVIANINGLAEFLTTAMKEIDVVVDDFDRGQSCVYLAQLALCDSCKWTSDYELPKEAY